MCITTAYIIRHGKPEVVMENVESVKAIGPDVWNLSGLFGEEKQIVARMKSALLLENQLFFEDPP
jgi:predicted RNA-binding protein